MDGNEGTRGMDDRKFDDLTRFVGRRTSRRALVKGAAAAALAAVLGSATNDGNVAEAAVYEQGGVKQRIRVFCNQAGQLCKNSLNPTRRCCYRCGPGNKCCEAEGYACTKDSQCCDGLICRDPDLSDGVNLKGCFAGGELNPGAECLENAECESESCIDGACCSTESICIVDPYNPDSNECCDPDTEVCTTEHGCCPSALVCYDHFSGTSECCDGYHQVCIDRGRFICVTIQEV